MTFAYDGASMFDLAAAKAAGGIICTVYIVGDPGGMPHADAARVAAIRAQGMGALPNWERAADFFLTCSVTDARNAGAEALGACKALGFPADGSIQCAFSIDVQVPPSRFAEIGQKIDAVQAGLTSAYRAMVYAQSDLIDYLVAHGHVTGKQWLMGSTWGNPYNAGSPNVCMVQSHDAAGNWLNSHVGGTDVNTVTDPNAVGAWWSDNSPYGGFTLSDITAITTRLDALEAHLRAQDERITSLFQVDATGDGKSDYTGTVQSADRTALAQLVSQVAALQAAVGKLQTAGVDPVAVAQAIAQHVKLAAQ